jgi:hypothetical protein
MKSVTPKGQENIPVLILEQLKIEDPFVLSLFMKDNDRCTSHAPSTDLSGIQHSSILVLKSFVPHG